MAATAAEVRVKMLNKGTEGDASFVGKPANGAEATKVTRPGRARQVFAALLGRANASIAAAT